MNITIKRLQIRLPKKVLDKIDDLIISGLFQSRSEIIRDALRKYINESNCKGVIPFIVGPFTAEQIEILNNTTFESLIPPENIVEEVRKELKSKVIN